LKKISPELKDELINLIFEKETSKFDNEISNQDILELDDIFDSPPEDTQQETLYSYNPTEVKKVIEIDLDQTHELMSNLSEKSIQTLKLFCSDNPVHLDSLIGEDKTYKSYIELKRSFVGPVNRRLRTVTKNKSAMLFLKVSDDEFSVRSNTAISLTKYYGEV